MPNLIKSNFIAKVNMTLLETAEIVDQNGGKNVGKTNCGNDKLVFLARAIREGRRSGRRRLQMWLGLNNRRRVVKLGCLYYCLYYYIIPKEHHSSSSSSFLPLVSPRFIYFVIFSKNMTRSTPPKCLLSNPVHSFLNTEDRPEKWFMHFMQVLFLYF